MDREYFILEQRPGLYSVIKAALIDEYYSHDNLSNIYFQTFLIDLTKERAEEVVKGMNRE